MFFFFYVVWFSGSFLHPWYNDTFNYNFINSVPTSSCSPLKQCVPWSPKTFIVALTAVTVSDGSFLCQTLISAGVLSVFNCLSHFPGPNLYLECPRAQFCAYSMLCNHVVSSVTMDFNILYPLWWLLIYVRGLNYCPEPKNRLSNVAFCHIYAQEPRWIFCRCLMANVFKARF